MRCIFFPLLLLHTTISTEDYSVELNGTIGTIRFVMLSQNTVSCEGDFTQAGGGIEYFLGTMQIDLFDNTGGGGTVYMNNLEYVEDTWRATLPGNGPVSQGFPVTQQVRLNIYEGTDNLGTLVSDAVNPVALHSTVGDVENHRIDFAFYAVDDADNSTRDGTFYGNFLFFWTD